MKYDLKKLGIILVVYMLVMPVWSLPLTNTNNTKQDSKNLNTKNLHLSQNPLNTLKIINSNTNKTINLNENTLNQKTVSKLYYNNFLKNRFNHIGKNSTNYLVLRNINYNPNLENKLEYSSLVAIKEQYNLTLNEYDLCCDSLDNMNDLNDDLEANCTHLNGVKNSLQYEIDNFILSNDNEDEYNNLCARLNDTQSKIRTANQVQNEVKNTIINLKQKKKDYLTILTALNQTLKEGTITPQSENTIKTVIQKHNQRITDTNNSSQTTEIKNTIPTTIDNNNDTLNIIESSNNNNDTSNSTTNNKTANNTIDDTTGIYALDGTLMGLKLLGYGIGLGINLKVSYLIYKTPIFLCQNYLNLLGRLTKESTDNLAATEDRMVRVKYSIEQIHMEMENARIEQSNALKEYRESVNALESTRDQPVKETDSLETIAKSAETKLKKADEKVKELESALENAEERLKLASEEFELAKNAAKDLKPVIYKPLKNVKISEMETQLEQMQPEIEEAMINVETTKEEYLYAVKDLKILQNEPLADIEKLEIEVTWRKALIEEADQKLNSLTLSYTDKMWDLISLKDSLRFTSKTTFTNDVAKLIVSENPSVKNFEFIQTKANILGISNEEMANLIIERQINTNSALISNMLKSESKCMILSTELNHIGLPDTIDSARSAFDTLLNVGVKNERVFNALARSTSDMTLSTSGEFIAGKTLSKTVFASRIIGAVTVVMDIWTVASVVSWAGKEFGWWKKDYVNDWLPF